VNAILFPLWEIYVGLGIVLAYANTHPATGARQKFVDVCQRQGSGNQPDGYIINHSINSDSPWYDLSRSPFSQCMSLIMTCANDVLVWSGTVNPFGSPPCRSSLGGPMFLSSIWNRLCLNSIANLDALSFRTWSLTWYLLLSAFHDTTVHVFQ
jgi:hypothetical protein